MRQVEFVPFRLTETAEIFSIRIDDEKDTETTDFLISFKDTDDQNLQMDFRNILNSLEGISRVGASESYFRPEGKMSDRVCALPIYTAVGNKALSGTLRLYCIRISNKLLIVGGGGVKTTQTYEEDDALSEKVETMQKIDNELAELEKNGMDLHKEIYNLTIYIQ